MLGMLFKMIKKEIESMHLREKGVRQQTPEAADRQMCLPTGCSRGCCGRLHPVLEDI